MKGSRQSPMVLVLVSILLLSFAGYILSRVVPYEAFFGAQGGEMVQLAAGHVPTAEDLEDEEEEQKQVYKEIVNMTGYW
jgi:hypothetical protein